MKLFQRILVATDFSPASTPAFEESVKIAKREGALLLIANAYQEPGLVELSRAPADVEAFLAAQFRAKAKATSIGRRLSSLRRFYRMQVQRRTPR